MTEEEAKTKWCPFARVGGVWTQIAPNRDNADGTVDRLSRCIGSACMAWRWEGKWYLDGMPKMPETPTDGYCGLAVRP